MSARTQRDDGNDDETGKEYCPRCGRVHLYQRESMPPQYVCSLGHQWTSLASVSQARPDQTQG